MGSYNACLLFICIDKSYNYSYLEMIPKYKLEEYSYNDLDNLKTRLEDIAHKSVMPQLLVSMNSQQGELNIKYSITEKYEEFSIQKYSLEKEDVLSLFKLCENIYKKAEYYFSLFDVVPFIHKDNLMVDKLKNEVAFRCFGKTLCPRYSINGHTIRNDEKDEIPKMISLFLKDVLSNCNDKDLKEFLVSPKTGISLFLALFIGKLGSKDSSLRYSYKRFSSMVHNINSLENESDFQIRRYYYKERMYSLIFKNCYGKVS